ncbi:MAG: ATP-binding protein, partial [Candidatus Promineifilaceae bacterium]
LPLAIELAAARIRHFSPQALRQRLGSRLNLLRGGARDLPERQQTLRDTIDWSYELLSELEQNLFAVLSVFAGCTFEAAEAVASESVILAEAEVETLEAVESLVDKSLLRILDDGTAEPRLRMLETIREYAGERLQENPDRHEAVRRAHAAYFSDFTQEQRRRLTGYEREKALEALAAEFENLQIAWQYWAAQGDFNQLQKMVDGLWMLYEGRGWYQGMVELTTELLEVLAKTPSAPEHAQQEIMLRTTLARALMAIKGFTPEVEESFKEALVLSEGLGEIPQLFPVLRGLSTYYQFRMDFEKAAEMGERILVLAESRDDDSMRLHAYLMLGSSIGFFAGIESGLKWLDKGITLFDPARQRLQPFQIGNSPGIVCYTASALYLLWLGLPDKAIKRAEKAVELATRLEHPYTKTYAYFHTGILFMWYGDLQRAQKNALAMREIAAEYEYHLWHALATILLGALESLSGETEGGLARLEEGIAAYAGHITPPVFWPMLTVIRAAAYGRAGKPAEGVDLLDELLVEGSPLADLMLLKGELLLQESASNAAEATGLLKQSLDISQIAGNKLWALQAATNLARLELRQGQVGEGSRVLAELYSSFSEGFETVDLQVARALLDELAGET